MKNFNINLMLLKIKAFIWLIRYHKKKTSGFQQGFKRSYRGRGRGRGNFNNSGRSGQTYRGGQQGGQRGRGTGRDKRDTNPKIDRQSSVKIGADWTLIEQFDLAQLTKLSTKIPDAEDLVWAGELAIYNDIFDRCSTKHPIPLQRMDNAEFYYVTTTDDPAMEKFAKENAADVYGTDAILSLLMASPRSVYPWDIVVQKIDGALVFDKRDTATFDFLTVSETSHEPPTEAPGLYEDDRLSPEQLAVQRAAQSKDPKLMEINSPSKLSIEATMINQNFSQQILRSDLPRNKLELPNPFATTDNTENSGPQPAAVAYRYRKFKLGDRTLISRTELHGIAEKRGEKLYMTAYALNEWDSRLAGGIDWRQKIDSQRGAVLATELKNNSCKLARWTAQSVLAGADQMKIGYVSRVSRANPYDHLILATQFYKPKEFANQITLNINNMWGIMKMLIDLLFSKEDGKFVIVRDANKPIVRIFSVPINTFKDDDDDDSDDNQADNDDNDSSDED
mmetsp:Transcript_6330/g.8097  ORF Transcript_6330/g.8097 Transcript_6330/m.8097 type:complete len:506 (+) Transcript_6330:297-1814(+)